MGSLTVIRRKAIWRDRLRAYAVMVDGVKVGEVSSGAGVTVPLAAGQHEVRMKIDWCGSPPVWIDGADDASLVCDAGGNSFMVLIDVLFRSDRYISLERAD